MIKNLITIILVLFTTLLGSYAYTEFNQPLNQNVLRLHVVANSDSPADQALKLEIKDRIVSQMGEEFKDIDSAQEARRIAISKKSEIKAVAETIVTSRGYDYPVEVYVGEFEFPTKSYGNLVFPQGRYEAVRVVLGEGGGKNWWCVLFPPLCMVSSSDKGLSLARPAEAQVSLKCLELLPQGVKVKISGK